MTDRPGGSTIPVEVGRVEEVMSVADSDGVPIGLVKDPVIRPEDGASESVRVSVGATLKVDKSESNVGIVPVSEAIML